MLLQLIGSFTAERADLAQLVEQLFRKQQVWGSSPQVGSRSITIPGNWPKWRNRQTRYVQGVVPVRAWEFKSPLRHPTLPPASQGAGCTLTSDRATPRSRSPCGNANGTAVGRRMVADPAGSEESPSCAERGAWRKPGRRARVRRQSRLAHRPRPV